MSTTSYLKSHKLKPLKGDIIAFSGKGILARIVKAFTSSKVSHVGIMINSAEMIEASYGGVKIVSLAEVLKRKDDKILCRLYPHLRPHRNKAFDDFTLKVVNKEYDLLQCIKLGLGIRNKEDFKKLFCSELVGGYLEAIKAIPTYNVSGLTPIEIYNLPIYETKEIITGSL